MAGPARQRTLDLVVPLGEDQREYAPDGLAWKIENLEDPGDRTLRSLDGPCPYEPPRKASALGAAQPHGVFHARLRGGMVDMLLLRAGDTLYRHDGTVRGWKTLLTGLSDDASPRFPDQFVLLNDRIIWTNGVDRARTIDFRDRVEVLGFDRVPSAPTTFGPSPLDNGDAGASAAGLSSSRETSFPNCLGYSWQGGIGTPGGLLEGQSGSILAGAWYYVQQWEDGQGNLSALSPVSSPVYLWAMQADPYSASQSLDGADTTVGTRFPFGNTHIGVELDDLTRQFAAQMGDDAPENAKFLRIYRTSDARNADNTMRFLDRFSFAGPVTYPDTRPDSVLQAPAVDRSPVPVFRLATTHQGALIIANTPDDPGLVMRSDPGFSGTFASHQRVYPDSGGAEVTAVTTHGGVLLAFTATSVYSLEDFGAPRPLSRSVGCAAPSSVQALPSGELVWMSHKGMCAWVPGSVPRVISDGAWRLTRTDLNQGSMRMAVAAVSPETGEYRCALAPAEDTRNTLMVGYSGGAFKRYRLGYHVGGMAACSDYRELLFMAAIDLSLYTEGASTGMGSTVYVMDRELPIYIPPARTAMFQSGWMQADALGITPVNLRTLYVALKDTNVANARVTFYKNGSWKPLRGSQPLRLVGMDTDTSIVTDSVGSAIVGQSDTHRPRRFWRKVAADITDAYSWAFKIECDYPDRLHLVAFSFDLSTATQGNARERLPGAVDT